MPIYDYDCAACGRRFELVPGVHAEPPTVCPLCGSGPIRKAISAPAIHYKGSGWAKKERRTTAASSSQSSSEGASAGATGSAGSGSGDKGSLGDKGATDSAPAAKDGSGASKKTTTETAAASSTD